jgi:hypothetical protein
MGTSKVNRSILIICIAISAFLIFGCTSNATIDQSAPYSGRLADREYENNYLGFEIKLPPEYEFINNLTYLSTNPESDITVISIREKNWTPDLPQFTLIIMSKQMSGGARNLDEFIRFVNGVNETSVRNYFENQENISSSQVDDYVKMVTYKPQEFRQLEPKDFHQREFATFSRSTPNGTDWLIVLQQDNYFIQIIANHLIAPESSISEYLDEFLSFITFIR